MRAIFYSGLLVLALTQPGPITLASSLASSDPSLHIPVDFVRWSGLGSLDGTTIWFLRNLCLLSWICSAVGLFTGPAKVATALTLLPLHALSIGIHYSHGWYVPVYTLLFLCLARSDHGFSVDALIRRKWPGWMRPTPQLNTVGSSGLPAKLVLLGAVHTLFAAGISKLHEGGWPWIDGHSLQSYISLTWDGFGTGPRFPLIAHAILSSQTLRQKDAARRRGTALLLVVFHPHRTRLSGTSRESFARNPPPRYHSPPPDHQSPCRFEKQRLLKPTAPLLVSFSRWRTATSPCRNRVI